MDIQNKQAKRLFISDLDGTLLNNNAMLSDYTVEALNSLICSGMNFTVATARTAATVEDIMSRVNITLPVVLMNGASIYDMVKKEYLHYEKIDGATVEKIISVLQSKGVCSFAYGITNNKIVNYRGEVLSHEANDFYAERVKKYKKNFTIVDSFMQIAYENIIYLSIIDNGIVIENLYSALKNIKGINIIKYNDTYDDKIWYLEIFSSKASKYHATVYLMNKYKFSYVTGFGDNLNDIALFSACDSCYAPINAKQELKKIATGIIDSNENNGVAKWILKNFSKND